MALFELVSRAESGNDADTDYYPAACQACQGIIAPMGPRLVGFGYFEICAINGHQNMFIV